MRHATRLESRRSLPRILGSPGNETYRPSATGCQDRGTPASGDHKPAIVTIRRKPERILPPGLLAETPEEHQRRAEAADALWRELVRRVAEKRP